MCSPEHAQTMRRQQLRRRASQVKATLKEDQKQLIAADLQARCPR